MLFLIIIQSSEVQNILKEFFFSFSCILHSKGDATLGKKSGDGHGHDREMPHGYKPGSIFRSKCGEMVYHQSWSLPMGHIRQKGGCAVNLFNSVSL